MRQRGETYKYVMSLSVSVCCCRYVACDVSSCRSRTLLFASQISDPSFYTKQTSQKPPLFYNKLIDHMYTKQQTRALAFGASGVRRVARQPKTRRTPKRAHAFGVLYVSCVRLCVVTRINHTYTSFWHTRRDDTMTQRTQTTQRRSDYAIYGMNIV